MSKHRQQQNLPQSLYGGYTIIESLVAMIVVSVLMIAIALVTAFLSSDSRTSAGGGTRHPGGENLHRCSQDGGDQTSTYCTNTYEPFSCAKYVCCCSSCSYRRQCFAMR